MQAAASTRRPTPTKPSAPRIGIAANFSRAGRTSSARARRSSASTRPPRSETPHAGTPRLPRATPRPTAVICLQPSPMPRTPCARKARHVLASGKRATPGTSGCGNEPPAQPYITETYKCRPLGILTDEEQASRDAVCPEGPTCACEWDAGYALFKGPKLPPDDPDASPNTDVWPNANFECAEGGIGWTARKLTTESGCGGCYGSPRARLDRLVA